MSSFEYFLICLSLGILASLNPFLISIFLSKISADFGQSRNRSLIGLNVFIYIVGFITGALLLSAIVSSIFLNMTVDSLFKTAVFIAIVASIFGIFKIAGYFRLKPVISTPRFIEAYIHFLSTKKIGLFSSLLLGLTTVLLLMPSLGIIIIMLNAVLIISGVEADAWGLVFVLATSLSVVALTLLILNKARISTLIKWKEDSKLNMRLYTGLLEIVVAWVLLSQIAGTK